MPEKNENKICIIAKQDAERDEVVDIKITGGKYTQVLFHKGTIIIKHLPKSEVIALAATAPERHE